MTNISRSNYRTTAKMKIMYKTKRPAVMTRVHVKPKYGINEITIFLNYYLTPPPNPP